MFTRVFHRIWEVEKIGLLRLGHCFNQFAILGDLFALAKMYQRTTLVVLVRCQQQLGRI